MILLATWRHKSSSIIAVVFTRFLPCDAMRKRGLCCRSVSVRLCPSVRLSVTFMFVQTAEDIVKLLSRPGSPIILVFLTPSADTQF